MTEENKTETDLPTDEAEGNEIEHSQEADEEETSETIQLDPIAVLEQQNEELENRLARTQAEVENVRKRSRREIEEARKYQNIDLVRSLIPAIDNLDRAVAAAEQNATAENLVTGVKMVANQFSEILGQFSVNKIQSLNQPFDPNLHEALQQVPSEEHPPSTVIQEVEAGYTLHERVVRPSKVIVSIASPTQTEETTESSDDNNEADE